MEPIEDNAPRTPEGERVKELTMAVKNLRTLAIQICRKAKQEDREERLGHVLRIADAAVGPPSILRDHYTEGTKGGPHAD
jgi:hypothetical protein